jgi:hypothetical protein
MARFAVQNARNDRMRRADSAWSHLNVGGAPPALEMRLRTIRRKRVASRLMAATRFAVWIAGLSALAVITGALILSIH